MFFSGVTCFTGKEASDEKCQKSKGCKHKEEPDPSPGAEHSPAIGQKLESSSVIGWSWPAEGPDQQVVDDVAGEEEAVDGASVLVAKCLT